MTPIQHNQMITKLAKHSLDISIVDNQELTIKQNSRDDDLTQVEGPVRNIELREAGAWYKEREQLGEYYTGTALVETYENCKWLYEAIEVWYNPITQEWQNYDQPEH